MPVPPTDHLCKRMHKDHTDVCDDACHHETPSIGTVYEVGSERRLLNLKILSPGTPEAVSHSYQHCVDSLRASLLNARLALLEYSLELVRSYEGGGRHLLQHVQPARVTRLEQHMAYLAQLRGAAKHRTMSVSNDQQRQHPDDGIFEACQHALENALCVLERVPNPSYMVDLNEVTWQALASMSATQCVETGITVTLPIILGNPQVLNWLMTELLAGSALECLQVAEVCHHSATPLLTVDYLDTINNWRLNVSVSHVACLPTLDVMAIHTRPSLSYVKQAIALLEGDFWVEAVSHEEMTFSLSLPKRLSFA